MSTRLRGVAMKRSALQRLAIVVAIIVAGSFVPVQAHKYCKACVQTCVNNVDTGCQVYYANAGVYTKTTCLSGGTTCTMTYNTLCFTLKKICSYSACVGNDCESTVCTTYSLSNNDGSSSFTGDTSCAN